MDEKGEEKQNENKPAHFEGITLSPNESTACAFDCFSMQNEMDVFPTRQPRQVHWSVVWSDIMMTMFIMFAVLYIYQAANRDFRIKEVEKPTPVPTTEKKASSPIEEKKQTPDEYGEFKLEMMKHMEQPTETVRLETLKDMERIKLQEDKAIRIVLPADLLFDTGKAEIKTRALNSLREIADQIKKNEDMINVVGHTDDVPIHSDQFATNWELSVIRACVVTRFLIEQMRIPPERFYISGHSYFQPIKPNNSIQNRAENRRVEIILTKKKPNPTKSGE